MSRSWSRAVVLLAALVACAGTARLGLWQLDRAQQKLRLQAELDARQQMPPLGAAELARRGEEAAAQWHRHAVLEGRWLHERTVYLDNRQMAARVGFVILTPLQLDDGSAVLVERGWVPRDFQDRTRLTPPPPEPGRIRVEGRITDGPSRVFDFDASQRGTIRQNVDLAAFGAETGLPLRPVAIRQTGPQPSPLQRDWPQPATGVDKHHGYAFQWFALSALILCLYVWFQVLRPRRRAAS